ncbi:Hypothetical protein NocV09_12400020 [Nannochloropsis oceanica]
MQQHSCVYLSTDRWHSNNFVQKVLDKLLAHFKEVVEKAAAGVEECAMRRLCVWSDGCGGQFKQVADEKIVGSRRRTHDLTFRAPSTISSPAAMVRGLAMGWEGAKTFLRDEEMKKGNHLGTSQDVFNRLVKHKQYHDSEELEAETGIQLKANSRTFVFVELVGVDKDVVRDMAAIKPHHCFVTCGGYILIFPTSCTYQPCRNMKYDECELVASEERGGEKGIDLQTFGPAIQEKRRDFGSTFEREWAVMDECKVDDRVLMRADVDQRKAYSEEKPKNWTCRGSVRLAQIAELPKQHATGGTLLSRARKSEGTFLVKYAQEHKQEEEWLFKSAFVCFREGGDMPKTWKECSY